MDVNQNPNRLDQVLSKLRFSGFTEVQKNTIIDWIQYLYGDLNVESGSNIARGVFNKLIDPGDPDKFLQITESSTDERVRKGFAAIRGKYEVFVDFTNEFNEGYISETGEFVEYDIRLGFMHEIVHAIEGLSDNDFNRGYTSRADSAGDTQHFTNNVHAELGAPLRISYDGRREIYGSNEQPPNIAAIKKGTQFTKNKLASGENPEITLGVFVTESTVDTSNNNPATNDLLISGGLQGNKNFSTGGGNDYLYGGSGEDTLESGSDNDYLNGGKRNDSLNGGTGEDTAEFSSAFEDYDIEIEEDNGLITINHEVNNGDGTDTLEDIEWAIFQGEQPLPLPINAANTEPGIISQVAAATGDAPRIIPLPLEDGVEQTQYTQARDTTTNPNTNDLPTPPYLSLSAPVSMLDGNIDYTLNISYMMKILEKTINLTR